MEGQVSKETVIKDVIMRENRARGGSLPPDAKPANYSAHAELG